MLYKKLIIFKLKKHKKEKKKNHIVTVPNINNTRINYANFEYMYRLLLS